METVWEDICDYAKWLFLGQQPDNRQLDRTEARKDLCWRLFIIANAPVFIAFHGTYWISMNVATYMQKYIYSHLSAKYKKLDGILTTLLYVLFQIVTFGSSLVYIVFPIYKAAFYFFRKSVNI